MTTWWRILQNSVFSKSKCSFAIAKGIEAADAVTKAAEVGLFFAKAGCPGKYYLLFSGEVAAVQASLDAGCAIGGSHVVDQCVIPRVHPQVVRAIGMTNLPEEAGAVGVMEFYSVTASIYGADAAVKAADVSLLDVRLGTGIGGKSFVILVGDVAAVTESVRCGIHTPNAEGMLVASVIHIILLCIERKVTLRSVSDGYVFEDNIDSKTLAFTFGLVSEIERKLVSIRTKEALALIRSKGVVLGRPKGSQQMGRLEPYKEQIEKDLKDPSLTYAQIAEKYNVSLSSFKRFLKEYLPDKKKKKTKK